jgi:hypothetical protein
MSPLSRNLSTEIPLFENTVIRLNPPTVRGVSYNFNGKLATHRVLTRRWKRRFTTNGRKAVA